MSEGPAEQAAHRSATGGDRGRRVAPGQRSESAADHHRRDRRGGGREPGRGLQALSQQGRHLGGGHAWVRAQLLAALDEAAAGGEPSPWRRWRRCSGPICASSRPIPGCRGSSSTNCRIPQDTAVKREVRALLQAYRRLLLQLLDDAAQRGDLPADVDRDAAATLFVGTVQGLVMQSMIAGKPTSVKLRADRSTPSSCAASAARAEDMRRHQHET